MPLLTFLADHMFSGTYGPTPPEHLYFLAGQSKRVAGQEILRGYCDNGRARFIHLKRASRLLRWERRVRLTKISGLMSEVPACLKLHTIFAELDEKRLPWRYYVQKDSYQDVARAIINIRHTKRWRHVHPPGTFRRDAFTGRLPAVSYLIPPPRLQRTSRRPQHVRG